ncbi:MAG TPA: hypothetical protein VFR25_10115, partial [Candidatus Eisenbacteria bacterium]|nr:hypothetical protein [Candidatus Eisenbacteria bacterium]
DDVFQAAFTPDGKNLAAIRAVGDLFQLEAPLGTVIYRTKAWMSHPRYSPDGTQIAFLNHPWIGSNGGHVCVVRPGEEPRRLTENIPTMWKLAWRPDGREIWFTGTGDKRHEGILGVTLDGRLRVVYAAPGYLHIEDIAGNGDALLDMMRSQMRIETSTRADGPAAATDLSWLDWSLLRDLSDDGSLVLFDEAGQVAEFGVFLRTVDGAPAIRLADGVCASTLSPDGRFVLSRKPGGSDRVHVIPIGVGQARTIATGDCSVIDGDWLPDGRGLIVSGRSPEGRHLYYLDLSSGSLRRLHDTTLKTSMLFVSPDGLRVLARGADSLVTVFPMDGSDPRSYSELTMDWKQCGWQGDSRHFFAYRAGALPAPVVRVDADTGSQEPWMDIMPMVRSGVDSINSVQFDRSAERYACCYISNESHLFHAQGIR